MFNDWSLHQPSSWSNTRKVFPSLDVALCHNLMLGFIKIIQFKMQYFSLTLGKSKKSRVYLIVKYYLKIVFIFITLKKMRIEPFDLKVLKIFWSIKSPAKKLQVELWCLSQLLQVEASMSACVRLCYII